MNFRQMRYVIALSEELNFSHAAQRLYISQPSLSQYIRAIEDEIGTQLFDRSGGHVSLTPAGERFVEIAREILALADHLKEAVVRAGKGERGLLRIGVSDSGSIMMPLLLPELQNRFPETQISFVEQPVGELEVRVLNGELDLIFTMLPMRQREKFEIVPILRDDFLIACPRALPAIQVWLANAMATQQDAYLSNPGALAYPQTDFPALPLSLLLSLPYITVKLSRFEFEMDRALGDATRFKPNVIMEVANVITALSMVAAGNGICPVPATIIRLGVQDPKVFYCRIGDVPASCELAVSHRKGTQLTAAANAYVDMLKTLVKEKHLDL